MKRALVIFSLSLAGLASTAMADTSTIVGGALGGAAGAAVGEAVGGRNGAIIGGAVGGASGAAIGHDYGKPAASERRNDDGRRYRKAPSSSPPRQGLFLPAGTGQERPLLSVPSTIAIRYLVVFSMGRA
ncbi:glycine zipper domain-containing protein [Chromobacterium haemolyticum]|nr:glycine zipper domain-containing protein [Chromobacterium haemolyticum]